MRYLLIYKNEEQPDFAYIRSLSYARRTKNKFFNPRLYKIVIAIDSNGHRDEYIKSLQSRTRR